MYTEIDKHPDILLLEKRLNILVKREDYEGAIVIKKWIEEISVYHKEKINKNMEINKKFVYL